MENYDINCYLGRFGDEEKLFSIGNKYCRIPTKGEFIYFDDEMYKVLYTMTDVDNKEVAVFVREAIEEDF